MIIRCLDRHQSAAGFIGRIVGLFDISISGFLSFSSTNSSPADYMQQHPKVPITITIANTPNKDHPIIMLTFASS